MTLSEEQKLTVDAIKDNLTKLRKELDEKTDQLDNLIKEQRRLEELSKAIESASKEFEGESKIEGDYFKTLEDSCHYVNINKLREEIAVFKEKSGIEYLRLIIKKLEDRKNRIESEAAKKFINS